MSLQLAPVRLPKMLRPDELDRLRAVPKNLRDQALIEVMAGCGLRVSEACSLTLDAVHWSSDTPWLRFIGKRGRERVVPLNLQAQDALRTWLEARSTLAGPFVFCNLRSGERLSRRTVWDALRRHAQRAGIRHVHPHMLRHTFGTTLADRNVPIERIRELMGHASITTSQLYITVSSEHKREAVERLDQRPGLLRWFSRVRNRPYRFFSRPVRFRPHPNTPTVGRQTELRRLQANLDKRVDTLLLGPVGVGKSHLLAQLSGDRLIRLRRLSPPKQALLAIAEVLYNQGLLQDNTTSPTGTPSLQEEGESLPPEAGPDQEPVGEPASVCAAGEASQEGFEEFKKAHGRTSIQDWTRMVVDAVEKDQWVLIIDDLSDLSPALGRLLEQLGQKYVVLGAALEIPKRYERHFWGFERVQLDNLPPAEARQLIRQGAAGLEVEDAQLLETQILQQSTGNPRAIVESLARLRKEPQVTPAAVRELVHSNARPQIDLTPVVLLGGILLLAARFIARGLGETEIYLLAGLGSVVAMGARFFLFRMRSR